MLFLTSSIYSLKGLTGGEDPNTRACFREKKTALSTLMRSTTPKHESLFAGQADSGRGSFKSDRLLVVVFY